jgi:hypothetical protein
MSYDSAAWGALAFALSTLLGVVTFFRWRSQGLVVALRWAGWTILPVAAWLTGVLELTFEVGESVGDWALDLVFKPTVWLGIVLAGISAVLFGTSALMRNRGLGSRSSGEGSDQPPAIDAPRAKKAQKRRGGGDAAIGDGDLDDIEAILRKHGIS